MLHTLILGDNFSSSSSSFVFYIKHSMIGTIEIAHVPIHAWCACEACVFRQLNFWTMLNLKIIYRIKNNYVIINWFKDIHECRHSFSCLNRRIGVRICTDYVFMRKKWSMVHLEIIFNEMVHVCILWCIIAITAHLCKYRIHDVAALCSTGSQTHTKKKMNTTVNCLG